ncbi:metallophosphoesterase [Spirochaetia bacterium]|nr:metallophosphoesterase [Spirochaetia bacterium]
MLTLVLSDIHANVAAFKAVLNHAKAWDSFICLGDLVGYGPDPNECVALAASCAKKYPGGFVYGNNDYYARSSPLLTPSNRAFLERLPKMMIWNGILLSHGSPDGLWGYIFTQKNAEQTFSSDFSLCFVGHTHIPQVFVKTGSVCSTYPYIPEQVITFSAGQRVIANPGSVGLPRNRSGNREKPSAASAHYALFDSTSRQWQFKTAYYDRRATDQKILALADDLEL